MQTTHLTRLLALFGVFYITLDLSLAYMVHKEKPSIVKSFFSTIEGNGVKVLIPVIIALVVAFGASMFL
tara:strand:+ start:451 stop:657 length:207 start_codon:yes stop_codon:yes gene_type:complete